MKIITSLKTLPLISVIALGLALSPTLTMADDGNRGGQKTQYSNDRGQSHNKTHNKGNRRGDAAKNHSRRYVANSFVQRRHDKQSHKHKAKNHYDRRYDDHGYHRHGAHGHKHVSTTHNHRHTVIHDYGYRAPYVDLDNMRFMLGLHTGNFDIILRD